MIGKVFGSPHFSERLCLHMTVWDGRSFLMFLPLPFKYLLEGDHDVGVADWHGLPLAILIKDCFPLPLSLINIDRLSRMLTESHTQPLLLLCLSLQLPFLFLYFL